MVGSMLLVPPGNTMEPFIAVDRALNKVERPMRPGQTVSPPPADLSSSRASQWLCCSNLEKPQRTRPKGRSAKGVALTDQVIQGGSLRRFLCAFVQVLPLSSRVHPVV